MNVRLGRGGWTINVTVTSIAGRGERTLRIWSILIFLPPLTQAHPPRYILPHQCVHLFSYPVQSSHKLYLQARRIHTCMLNSLIRCIFFRALEPPNQRAGLIPKSTLVPTYIAINLLSTVCPPTNRVENTASYNYLITIRVPLTTLQLQLRAATR